MVSLNTLRTKFGVLLSVVIAGALLAFIFSLRDDVGLSGNDPEVGEIADDGVNYSEFSAAYEDAKTWMGGENVDYDQSAQIVSEAWQSLLTDRVLVPAYEDLGLTVTAAELEAMKRGEIPSVVYSSIFGNPSTGEYSIDAVNMFIEQARVNPEMYNVWKLINKKASIFRVTEKYYDVVRAGAYANALSVNKGMAAANNTYKGRFVVCNYNTVADSLVTVSDSEIKRYYKENMAKYKQTPYRTVNYVYFEVEATDADKKAVEEAAKIAGTAFAEAANLTEYTRNESHASLANAYVSADALSDEEVAALNAGRTFGPELQGDEWYASRVLSSRNVPATFELQHIVLPYADSKLADSLYTVARSKGTDFADLAAQYSGTETETVAYSNLPLTFADALAGATTGSVVKVQSGTSIFVTKVVSAGAVSRHYRLATLTYPVVPSQETLRAVHKQASSFAVAAKGSVEKFNEAAKNSSIMTSSMNVEQGSRNVPGLPNSLEVVRWAEGAKVGDVSELIKLEDNYVVAVVTAINEDDYKALESVSAQIKTALLREKKAVIIREKMQGANLDEIAANAGAKVETFADAKTLTPYVQGLGFEPRVIGVLATASDETKGALLPLVDGGRGVFAVVVDEIATSEEQTAEAEKVKAQAQEEMKVERGARSAVRNAIEVVDNTVRFF